MNRNQRALSFLFLNVQATKHKFKKWYFLFEIKINYVSLQKFLCKVVNRETTFSQPYFITLVS